MYLDYKLLWSRSIIVTITGDRGSESMGGNSTWILSNGKWGEPLWTRLTGLKLWVCIPITCWIVWMRRKASQIVIHPSILATGHSSHWWRIRRRKSLRTKISNNFLRLYIQLRTSSVWDSSYMSGNEKALPACARILFIQTFLVVHNFFLYL